MEKVGRFPFVVLIKVCRNLERMSSFAGWSTTKCEQQGRLGKFINVALVLTFIVISGYIYRR